MVSSKKQRVMITLSKKTIEDLKVLQDFYDLPLSSVINMLVCEKLQERKLK